MKPLPGSLFDIIANFFYSEKIKGLIKKEIAPEPGLELLDVPCGTGTLFDICSPCTYTGADIDKERVLKAQNRCTPGKFFVSDASKLPFAEKAFDLILAAGLFHHVDDECAMEILFEFSRVLKPTGRIIIFEAIWPRHCYNIVGYLARKIDQGKFVRYCEEYENLFKKHFDIKTRYFPSRLGLEYLLTTLVLTK
jgi:ubiquinone/menaquinone biosynthesis C-methylase UbiE